ncbi:proton-conducting transporter membrane subunit [Acidithiobacillus sp. AMEEHan]|uniref:proton-conducting transporter transmembrane domain-containing protein n=1 Tax=Acidithiobacillus sp. AMEEHan TaxID=2994951 RepID=UPI0027E527C5|nr:proton-conducting transporter membrane subunit [Acidithiobacillus sp. AMEEHan]
MVISATLWAPIAVAVAALLAFFLDLHPRLGRLAPYWGALGSLAATALVLHGRLDLGQGFYWDSSASILGTYLGLASAVLFLLLAHHPLLQRMPGAFTGLCLSVLLGALLLVGSDELLGLFLGLELQVLPFFALFVWPGSSSRALEAAMKYALLAALASALFALGIALIYLGNGDLALNPPLGPINGTFAARLGFILVLAALGFELAVAPFHAWVADIYAGAPTPAVLYLGAVGKVAIMGVLINLAGVSGTWLLPYLALAVLSIVVGNLLAWRTGSLRRMLGYSAVSHAGYFFAALAAGPLGLIIATFYALVYGLMHMGVFGPLLSLPEGSDEIPWRHLRQQAPLAAGLLAVSLLSLAGMPPTLGFFVKLGVLVADIHAQLWGLAIVLILGSALSFAYYLPSLWRHPQEQRSLALWQPAILRIYAAAGMLLLGLGWLLIPLFLGR